MDSKKAEALRKKYWEGKTDLNEEKELKNYLLKSVGREDPDFEYINFLSEKSNEKHLDYGFDEETLQLLQEKKLGMAPKGNGIKFWYLAASLILIISVSIIFKNEIFSIKDSRHVVHMDTFEDPEKAFEETKKALLYISSKLNQSGSYATQFSKFKQSQEILKQN